VCQCSVQIISEWFSQGQTFQNDAYLALIIICGLRQRVGWPMAHQVVGQDGRPHIYRHMAWRHISLFSVVASALINRTMLYWLTLLIALSMLKRHATAAPFMDPSSGCSLVLCCSSCGFLDHHVEWFHVFFYFIQRHIFIWLYLYLYSYLLKISWVAFQL